VDPQVGLEHPPADGGAQDAPGIVVRGGGDPGDALQLAAEGVVDGEHHRHIELEIVAIHGSSAFRSGAAGEPRGPSPAPRGI
jgi:hypothetical protein